MTEEKVKVSEREEGGRWGEGGGRGAAIDYFLGIDFDMRSKRKLEKNAYFLLDFKFGNHTSSTEH